MPASSGESRFATQRAVPASEKSLAGALTLFAAVVLISVGGFQFFQGLAALVGRGFSRVVTGDIYQLGVSSWAWIHVVLGIFLAIIGFCVLTGRPSARVAGIGIAAVSGLTTAMFFPYSPMWALTVIALDAGVIWALATVKRTQSSSPNLPVW
jgi:hypothetical protein